MEHDNLYISTYLVGSVKEEFTGRKEFDIYHHDYNKGSRWQSFQDIVSRVNSNDEDDLIVICYEGHQFADTYNRSSFLSAIFKCAELGTHLLIGGCDNFNNMVPISPNLYWIDMFSKSNFYVVFRPAFQTILTAMPQKKEQLEDVLSRILPNKLILNPFITDCSKECEATKKLLLYNRVVSKYSILK